MSYQSNRLRFALLMSLGASRDLRRIWFRGCWALMAVCIVPLFALSPWETSVHANGVQTLMFLCVLGFGASVTGLGMWVIAAVISFFGRQVKDDYQNDKLFD